MRLEVDDGLAKLLDGIKKKEPSIYGRGHAETVRFLANYYVHHRPLEQLHEDLELNLTHFITIFISIIICFLLSQVVLAALLSFIYGVIVEWSLNPHFDRWMLDRKRRKIAKLREEIKRLEAKT